MNDVPGILLADPLGATLLDLLYALQDADLPLILGGGYGLFLKYRHITESGERLLLSVLPPARSTDDLDVFLRTEILADSHRVEPLRSALDQLGFKVIASARNYQFARKFFFEEREWDIKVDLLTRQPNPAQFPNLKFDVRRVSPHPSVGIHAHTTPEAVAVEEGLMPLMVAGKRTNGQEYSAVVYLPSAYAFLMMKLFALRDQWQDESKDYGRKHALDIYTIVAMLTQDEYEQARAQSERYQITPEAVEAERLVNFLFRSAESMGSLRLREHPNFPVGERSELSTFLATLEELFHNPTGVTAGTDTGDAISHEPERESILP